MLIVGGGGGEKIVINNNIEAISRPFEILKEELSQLTFGKSVGHSTGPQIESLLLPLCPW